jgi:hypothetical protein
MQLAYNKIKIKDKLMYCMYKLRNNLIYSNLNYNNSYILNKSISKNNIYITVLYNIYNWVTQFT